MCFDHILMAKSKVYQNSGKTKKKKKLVLCWKRLGNFFVFFKERDTFQYASLTASLIPFLSAASDTSVSAISSTSDRKALI